jgi:hypothetical protein
MSISSPGAFRSIIREIFKAFTRAPVKFVVSGTDVSLADLEDNVASGVGKPTHRVNVFHELDTWPKLKLFLERYASSILNNPSWRCLQKRMQQYLQGRWVRAVVFDCASLIGNRYRLTASFLFRSTSWWHKLLNKYLEQYLTCPLGDTGLPFTSEEPDLLSARWCWCNIRHDIQYFAEDPPLYGERQGTKSSTMLLVRFFLFECILFLNLPADPQLLDEIQDIESDGDFGSKVQTSPDICCICRPVRKA